MQLQEILKQLKTTPTLFNIVMIVSAILFVVSFFIMLVSDEDEGWKFPISVTAMIIFIVTGLGLLVYTETSKDHAVEEAKITRVNDKIHIESNSEFMKSADLDVVAEKDGYIYVEFENKTYRIEDLSKKGN